MTEENPEENDQYTVKFANQFSPTTWDSYIGQTKVKERLQITIHAALSRFEQMDHCLILGESGTGKTSLANLIAQEHGVQFMSLMITPNFNMKVLNAKLREFEEEGGGIVFLDEIHNFTKKEQHNLYSILEEGCIAYTNGKKHYFLAPITIVGATTDERLLTQALRGRFGSPYRLEEYTDKEMGQIVERMAYKVGLTTTRGTCLALGRAAAGSPRQAASLIKTARDLGTMNPNPVLRLAEITIDGLTVDHIAYLKTMNALGMSAGLESLSNHTGRAKEDIVQLERLLARKNLIEINKTGRHLTPKGYGALKKVETGECYGPA